MSDELFSTVDPRLARAMVQAPVLPWENPSDIDLVLDVLADEPENALAAIVYAYLVCYHLFDDANVQRARQLLEGAMNRGRQVGAAAILFLDLDAIDEPDRDDQLSYIQRSIAAEPSWSLGYLHLSWFHKARGNAEDSSIAFKSAFDNLLPRSTELPPIRQAYETMFTGRLDKLI